MALLYRLTQGEMEREKMLAVMETAVNYSATVESNAFESLHAVIEKPVFPGRAAALNCLAPEMVLWYHFQ